MVGARKDVSMAKNVSTGKIVHGCVVAALAVLAVAGLAA